MPRVSVLILLLLAHACSRTGSQSPPAAGTPGDSTPYVIRDTSLYHCTIYGGELGLLYKGKQLVDTIDLHFGLHHVPTGVLFLPVRSKDNPVLGNIKCFAEHILYDEHTRTTVNTFLPAFDDWFSSPAVIDSVLYYWGVRDSLWAFRYDFRRARADSAFLLSQVPDSDYPSYFAKPVKEDGLIRYALPGGTFWLDADFRVVETRERP